MRRHIKKLVVTLALVPLSAPAHADAPAIRTESPTGKPKPHVQEARNAIENAIETCKSSMSESGGDWKQVDETDYLTYVVNRLWSDKLEPGISSFDASLNPLLDQTPSLWVPKCNAFFLKYVKGVGMTDMPLSRSCAPSASSALSLAQQAIADLQSPKASDDASKRVSWARKRLEEAWYTLYSPYAGLMPRCATPDRTKKAFAPLSAQFRQLEGTVAGLEKAKGVRFVRAKWGPPGDPRAAAQQSTAITYVDLTTQRPVTNPEQY